VDDSPPVPARRMRRPDTWPGNQPMPGPPIGRVEAPGRRTTVRGTPRLRRRLARAAGAAPDRSSQLRGVRRPGRGGGPQDADQSGRCATRPGQPPDHVQDAPQREDRAPRPRRAGRGASMMHGSHTPRLGVECGRPHSPASAVPRRHAMRSAGRGEGGNGGFHPRGLSGGPARPDLARGRRFARGGFQVRPGRFSSARSACRPPRGGDR